MRISDWSSDVCSSDLEAFSVIRSAMESTQTVGIARLVLYRRERAVMLVPRDQGITLWTLRYGDEVRDPDDYFDAIKPEKPERSEEHTSELQSLMRISYDVFCLKKKNKTQNNTQYI